MGTGMGNGAVTGDSFSQTQGTKRLPIGHQRFDTTVLIAKCYFKMVHGLAKTLETEMAWFNHTGMHRPNANLMPRLSAHAVKVLIARLQRLSVKG